MVKLFRLAVILAMTPVAPAALAQGAAIDLLGATYDASLPVEVSADQLTVEQESQTAVFEGNASVEQGALRISADALRIAYAENDTGVSQVEATGNVAFTNGSERASAQNALYLVGEGTITLTGAVRLVQGPNTISGDRLVLDLTSGKGAVEGNVKTIFTPNPDE